MFQELAKIDAVSKADIRRVANKTFVESNRTSARIDFQAPTATPVAAGNGGAK
jgi:predicted Zn-dependent peptidase